MGLTRIRAQQITDIDYKQAVRVVTTENVTLVAGASSGAPNQVDGVNLSTGNRILVKGQTNKAQNGLYQVETVGAGNSGTWIRTNDANNNGEIDPGMLVMVTEGEEYADTLWKLVTNGEIIIGQTELTFELNTAFGFGNISANGTGVVATVQNDTLSLTAGENITIVGNATSKTIEFSAISSTPGGNTAEVQYNNAGSFAGSDNFTFDGSNVDVGGNITASYFLGNGSQLSGIITSVANINNGTTNVSIDVINGPVTVDVDGIGNTAVFDTAGLTVTGNISANYFLGNGSQLSGIITSVANINNGTSNVAIDAADANITMSVDGTANVVVVSTGLVDVTGNLTTSGNIVGGGVRSTTSSTPPEAPSVGDVWYNTNNDILYRYTYDGDYDFWEDITGGSLVANSTAIINGTSTVVVTEADGNVAVTVDGVANTAVFAADRITVAGNLLPAANVTYSLGSSSQRWKELWVSNSTIYLGDSVLSATGNVLTVDGQSVITSTDSDTITLTGNITGGNIDTAGNVTGAYFIGNGSQLTGISTSTTKIFNGTSEINIGVANGAANVSIGTASNVAVFSETGVAVDGAVSAESVTATNGLLLNSNTVTANYTVASGFNAVSVGPMTVANNISVTVTAGQRWIVL